MQNTLTAHDREDDGDRGACRNESRAVTEGDHCSRVCGPPLFLLLSSRPVLPGSETRGLRSGCAWLRSGSSGIPQILNRIDSRGSHSRDGTGEDHSRDEEPDGASEGLRVDSDDAVIAGLDPPADRNCGATASE